MTEPTKPRSLGSRIAAVAACAVAGVLVAVLVAVA